MNRFVLLLLLWPWHAQAASVPLLLRPSPLDLSSLSVPDATKTCLRSGFDYNDGNYDSGNLIRIKPAGAPFTDTNTAWVLFDAEGPGVITSMWFTGKSKAGQAYLGGRLNFFFDGHAKPLISEKLPGLFETENVFPKPLAEKSSGGWICYAPIYFAKSLKITLTEHFDTYGHRKNGRGEMIPHIYHQFSYQRFEQPVDSTTRIPDPRWTPWRRDENGFFIRPIGLPTGERVPVYTVTGKGILKSLKFGWRGLDPDKLQLKISADGQTLVEMKVPEFWGFSRQARPKAKFQSILLGVDDDGRYYCAFPMPHRERFSVELMNSGAGGEVAVETIHAQGWPEPEHFYFHANRVTDRTERGRDIKILQASGRGHFVGTILELADATLEGDDRFYVDGESFPPAWHGTGTEDYFRCGWYFYGGPLTRPLYGLLDDAKPKIAYRFHVADRINFTRSVAIGFEHGHGNRYLGPFDGVVFWYGESGK